MKRNYLGAYGWAQGLIRFLPKLRCSRKQALDDAEMDDLLTMSSCFHSRRVAACRHKGDERLQECKSR